MKINMFLLEIQSSRGGISERVVSYCHFYIACLWVEDSKKKANIQLIAFKNKKTLIYITCLTERLKHFLKNSFKEQPNFNISNI